MNFSQLRSTDSLIGFALFLLVCIACYELMLRKRYVLLLVWPVLIYFCGPILTGIFAGEPFLGDYVFPENLLPETLLMLTYFVTVLMADKIFGMSQIIESTMSDITVRRLSHSPAFLPIFLVVSVLTLFLQIKLLHDFGSVLGGNYVLTGVGDGLIPFWGFLAGLYEIIFLLVVLFILSGDHGTKLRIFVLSIYVLTAGLRVFGGTRLILIKEIAFVVILFYMQGKIKRRQLSAVFAVVLIGGSSIGLLRMKDVGAEQIALGPIFGLVMESGLDALTLNIGYEVQHAGFTAQDSDTLKTLEYLALSSIPKFARFSITTEQLDALSPYNSALRFGYDSYTPAGGMSGFAMLCYMSSYPAIFTFLLALSIGFLFRYVPAGHLKRIVILVFLLNAIHFWRDPTDMAVKQVVQDVLCSLVLLCFSAVQMRMPQRIVAVALGKDTSRTDEIS